MTARSVWSYQRLQLEYPGGAIMSGKFRELWKLEGPYNKWALVALLFAAIPPVCVWLQGGGGMLYLRVLALESAVLATGAAFIRWEAHNKNPDLDLLGKVLGFYASLLALSFAIVLLFVEIALPTGQ